MNKLTRPLSREKNGGRKSVLENVATTGNRSSSAMAAPKQSMAAPKPSVFKNVFSHSKPSRRSSNAHGTAAVARNPLHDKLRAEGYSEDELQEYHQVFSLFDTGTVSMFLLRC